MQIEQNPMFRKNPVPWYDSNAVCLIGAVVMGGVCLFGAIGIRAAIVHPPYRWFIWVPVMLTFLSGGVLLSLSVRFIRRRHHR